MRGIKRWSDIPSSEITSEDIFWSRRKFVQAAGIVSATSLVPPVIGDETNEILRYQGEVSFSQVPPLWLTQKIGVARPSEFSTKEAVTPYNHITQHNNFYEFGSDKDDPAEKAVNFNSDPWSVEVSGEAEVRGRIALEDILKNHDLEERIYRLRCVEAWSMVVPWIGFPLADLVKRLQPRQTPIHLPPHQSSTLRRTGSQWR